jgi:hypothetical protein
MRLSRQTVRVFAAGVGVVAFWLGSCRSEAAEQIKFLKPVSLPAIGLRMRVMPDAAESPAPPPTVYTYVRTDNVSTSRVEMFAPYDLWRQSQQAARWTDTHGNSLLVATILRPLPRGFPREHVQISEYEAKLTNAPKTADAWSTEDLTRWAADFTRSGPVKPEAVSRSPPRLRNLVSFRGGGATGWWAAYAFRLNPAAAGQAGATQTWFFVMIEPASGVPADKAEQAIRQQFLPYLASASADQRQPGGPAAQFESLNRRVEPSESPEFMASRKLVRASIANLKNWWYVETKNYIILSNLGAENRRLVRDLQTNIEVLRSAFERLIPPRVPIRAVSVIRVFESSQEYTAYVGADLAWTYGLWMPAKKELVIRPLDTRDSREADAHLERAIYHEAFHQYIFYAMDELDASPWFNEGHAGFFENVEVKNGKIALEEDAERAILIRKDLSASGADTRALLRLTLPEFYAKDQAARMANYTLAWALIYYLRKTPVPEKPAAYQKILDTYCDVLWETKDPDQATAAAFKGIDLDGFQMEFTRFWNSDRKRTAARRNKLLP